MTRQPRGEARRDLSVDGRPLRIAGKAYASGVGTHASSMIPVSVPEGEGGRTLTGACGIDDGAKGKAAVRFSVLSGSETLWRSPVMRRGMPAEGFAVEVPAGAGRLYLLADEEGCDEDDHADWVGLRWAASRRLPVRAGGRVDAAACGMRPGTAADQSPALRRAITLARAAPGCTLEIPRGVYHLYPEGGLKMCFHISNHDQPVFHPAGMPLVDLRGVRVEGNGSLFIVHGLMVPLLIMDSSGVTVSGVSVDYARSSCSEARITAVRGSDTEVWIDPVKYPYEIRGGKIAFIGEGWESGIDMAMAFKKGTGHIADRTSNIRHRKGAVEDLGGGKVLFRGWDMKGRGLEPGDTLAIRTEMRPHPACVIYRSEKTSLLDVAVHRSTGMAFLAQRSRDIEIRGGGVFIRPGSGRVSSANADATHFSNCRGLVSVRDCLFEAMMDDAINVHSTCLRVTELLSRDSFVCRYVHPQSIGFEVFLPGETLRFINGPTLEPGETARVVKVRKTGPRELRITLGTPLPASVRAGASAIENADYCPSVLFRGNVVRNNRARGCLFTTPGRVVVENNLFDHSSGAAILLAGDAQGWYESGACDGVAIRGNIFIDNMTSRYQFTEGLVSIYPSVRLLDAQKRAYHRNVVIENNVFDTFDAPLLFALSAERVVFRNNVVAYNGRHQGWGKKPFAFRKCRGVEISGNAVSPPRVWTLDDCDLRGTPAGEVTLK